jgi:hypothetical protein
LSKSSHCSTVPPGLCGSVTWIVLTDQSPQCTLDDTWQRLAGICLNTFSSQASYTEQSRVKHPSFALSFSSTTDAPPPPSPAAKQEARLRYTFVRVKGCIPLNHTLSSFPFNVSANARAVFRVGQVCHLNPRAKQVETIAHGPACA